MLWHQQSGDGEDEDGGRDEAVEVVVDD